LAWEKQDEEKLDTVTSDIKEQREKNGELLGENKKPNVKWGIRITGYAARLTDLDNHTGKWFEGKKGVLNPGELSGGH